VQILTENNTEERKTFSLTREENYNIEIKKRNKDVREGSREEFRETVSATKKVGRC